jgi:hypothetical protein
VKKTFAIIIVLIEEYHIITCQSLKNAPLVIFIMAPKNKNFEELKERLNALKTEQRELQALYQERANQRVEYQNKMASLNVMLQKRSLDTMLIEDVVVVTLVAENNARERYALLPPAPTKTAITVEPGQKTKSLEEACNVYRSQIEVLEEMIEYRRTLTATERDLDLLYRQAVDDILDIMDEYCDDEKLKADMISFAAAGTAPCSPRKETKKRTISRILSSPGTFFSPKKEAVKDTMQNDLLPAPLSVAPPETPKQAFSHFKENAELNELKLAPLMDVSENDGSNNDGDVFVNTDRDNKTVGSPDRRKKKKASKKIVEVEEQDNENVDEKKTKKKKKKSETVTEESTTPGIHESSEVDQEAESDVIEKKKKKKKKPQEVIENEITLEDPVDSTKVKKKKKKGGNDQSESHSEKLEGNRDIEALPEDVSEPTEAAPVEKTKKKTKSKIKGTEDNNPPSLVNEVPVADNRESPKKKKKKKPKDEEETESELSNEKIKKKKNKEESNSGRKADL